MLKQRRILCRARNSIEISLLNLPLLFEAVAQDPVGLVRDRDANSPDIAVQECVVEVKKSFIAVSVEAQHARLLVLVMVDLVPEADGHVTPARAALVRIDIQIFEGLAGGLFGGGTRRLRDDDEC